MYKQVIIVRKDLKMSSGKIAAQACHACYESAKKADKKTKEIWESNGQKKIVVIANDLKMLNDLKKKADKLKIPNALIRDFGLTEIRKGSVTALGLGPDKEEKINLVTGDLKLL